jgi:pyruvate/2-oxoglutarate dehydrogenase complex dihydrolipoamide dehydrogenase (E3) component
VTCSAEGIDVRTDARAILAERWDGRWELDFEGREAVEADELLVATGRRPCFDGHDLEAAGVRMDEAGRPVLTDTLRTTSDHIWAGGDATGDLLFTHVGDYEARVIVADILERPFPRDYRVVPRVTFCEPEVASVGLTEDRAREAGHELAIGFERFAHNSRAFLDGQAEGHVKLVADTGTGEVLGGHIVGANAGELIHEVVVAMAGRVEPRAIANAVHAYPTMSQAVRNAFRQLAGE